MFSELPLQYAPATLIILNAPTAPRLIRWGPAHKSEEEASARAAAILPEADANEHGTGYAADILSTDYTAQDTGFADTRAYQWLTAYAAEYGFILRYPEDRQAITGVVFEPWHWRYVGVENALAIRASGLSLEEFLAEQKAL